MSDVKFPVFRKYSNDKSFFKIESDYKFTERQLIGDKYTEFKIEATQYPEMLMIMELIYLGQSHIQASSAIEFESIADSRKSI
jgi:hypothetical protein